VPDTKRLSVLKLEDRKTRRVEDDVVMEEPLEIRVNGESVSVTMRTPGNDFDLAVGLLWTEQIIGSRDEIGTIAYCPDEDQPDLKNIVNVVLLDRSRRLEPSRRLWSNSSCGLCGKATLDAIRRVCRSIGPGIQVSEDLLFSLPDKLREGQSNFDRTGGIHAAGLFDEQGKLLIIREDIGRHNAVDKILGAALNTRLPVSDKVLMVSGRLGFEIAQKALVAGIPLVASVSAPSSLAIELAEEFNMTTIGFLRGNSMNVYSSPQRIGYPTPHGD
jgi:FdhD protein